MSLIQAGTRVRTIDETRNVTRAADKANFKNLFQAAAYIRTTARRSIRKSKKASTAGTPPNTRAGQIRNAIVFAVDRQRESAVIGPTVERVGTSGSAHEHGGSYRGGMYPKRAFMLPALIRSLPRMPATWSNSVR